MEKKEVTLKPIVIILIQKRLPNGENSVLMQRRTKEKEKNGPFWRSWEFPQGKMRLGESLFDAAARELKEETGLNLTRILNPRQLGYQDFQTIPVEAFLHANIPIVVTHQFLGIPIIGEAEGNYVGTSEATEHCWVEKNQAKQFLRSDAVFTIDGPLLKHYINSH